MGGSAYAGGRELPEFDNFNIDYPFMYKGQLWPSAEALYQACKFKDESYREEIRTAPPECVWSMGQNREKELVGNFFENRNRVMYLVNYIRINQHPKLQELLLSTGDAHITFPGSDAYWGTRMGERGSNFNGVNLMRIRRDLRERSQEHQESD